MATKVSVAHKVSRLRRLASRLRRHAAVREQHGLTNAECTAAPKDPNDILVRARCPVTRGLFWASSLIPR